MNIKQELKEYINQLTFYVNKPSFNLFAFLNNIEIQFEQYGFRNNNQELNQEFTGNILIIRTDVIGDFICTSSFIKNIRLNFPKAKITLICSPIAYPLAQYCPYVDEIQVYNGNSMNRPIHTFLIDMLMFCYNNLWFNNDNTIKHYQVAFSPQYGSDNYIPIMLAFLSGAIQRIGYGTDVAEKYIYEYSMNHKNEEQFYKPQNNINSFLLTTNANITPNIIHEVDKHTFLLSLLNLPIKDSNLEIWNKEKYNLDINKKIIAVAVGAGQAHRIYNIKLFKQALKQIIKDNNNIELVLLGGFNEKDINIDFSCINLINKISLCETASIIEQCSLYIGSDTSLMHMAAAFNKPIIVLQREAKDFVKECKALFSSIARFKPYYGSNENKSIILQPDKPAEECSKSPLSYGVCKGLCNNKCINSIKPEDIVQAFNKIKNLYL